MKGKSQRGRSEGEDVCGQNNRLMVESQIYVKVMTWNDESAAVKSLYLYEEIVLD